MVTGDAPLPPPPAGDTPPLPPPPPPVVGYGKRTEALPQSGQRAPASILHAQHGAQPLPQVRFQGMQRAGGAYVPSSQYPFERNALITIAQLVVAVQGILGFINGVNALRQGIGASVIFGRFGVPGLAGGIIIDGVAITALSVAGIAAAVLATRPSNVARWLVVAWEVIVFLFTFTVLVQPLFFFGAAFLVIIPLLSAGINIIHPYLVLGMAGIVILAFALYPPTWQAYRR